MKKYITSTLLFALFTCVITAQDDSDTTNSTTFGARGGYSSLTLKVSADGGGSASEDVSGFYLGVFADIELSEKIELHPEINFGSYSEDGESSGVLLVPVLFKYRANEEFSLLAGPQFDYLTNEEDAEGLKRLGFGFAIGASYDISDKVIIDARYSFGITDRIDGDLDGFDVEARFHYLNIGLGYRF